MPNKRWLQSLLLNSGLAAHRSGINTERQALGKRKDSFVDKTGNAGANKVDSSGGKNF